MMGNSLGAGQAVAGREPDLRQLESRICDLTERARNSAERLSTLAERVYGPRTCGVQEPVPDEPRMGMVNALNGRIDDLAAVLAAIAGEMAVLEDL